MNVTSDRVKRVFKNIDNELPDALFIKNAIDPHIDLSFFYFTGLESGIFENSFFLAYPNGESSLFTSKLEEESTKKSSTGFKTIIFEKLFSQNKILKDIGSSIEKIGVNACELTYQDFLNLKRLMPKVKILDISKAISKTRQIKDETEIIIIRKAAKITTNIWKTIPSILKKDITENEVKAHITYQLQKENSTLSFETIVAFGKNTAEPHYLGGNETLKEGNFALFDFGAKHRRYCADLTRTIILGHPSDKHKQIYEIVLEANNIGLDAMREGEEACEIHKKVSKIIEYRGYKKEFTHATGHSLGLSVHDGYTINSNSKFTLKEGMVFTIEPGIYLPGFGGVRIEDDILIRKNSCEILTSTGRELLEI